MNSQNLGVLASNDDGIFSIDPHQSENGAFQTEVAEINNIQESAGNQDLILQQKIARNVNQASANTIDIFDQGISVREMKNIKQSVQNDVNLLKNRVRMLQLEHERAQKKILDTQQKTDQLEKLKFQNDQKYVKDYLNRERKKELERTTYGLPFAEQRKQRQQNIREAKQNMYKSKRQDVQAVKDQLSEYQQKKKNDIETEAQQKRIRSLGIKGQVQESAQQFRQFQLKKKNKLKEEFKEKTENEKRLIYKFEGEAQDLEKLEERLIIELQETQDEERAAYKELEEAMVEASIGKRERLGLASDANYGSVGQSSQLPGLDVGSRGNMGKSTSYNGFGVYAKTGKPKSQKSNGRNGHKSGQTMDSHLTSNKGSKPGLMAMNQTTTDNIF